MGSATAQLLLLLGCLLQPTRPASSRALLAADSKSSYRWMGIRDRRGPRSRPTPTPASRRRSAGTAGTPAAKSKASKVLVESPFDLTPRELCYRGITGQPVQPANRKVVDPPSNQTAAKMLQWLGIERPCMYFTQQCAQLLNSSLIPMQPHELTSNVHEESRPGLLGPEVSGTWRPFPRSAPRPGIDKQAILSYFRILFKGVPRANALKMLPSLEPGSLGTCAAVGNGDNLLKGEARGEEIDQHDFVVRFNTKMTGYEKYIGKKTDGLWTKPNYDASKNRGSQKPTRYHVNPKERDMTAKEGVPILPYGPSLRYWRQVANSIYTTYKDEKSLTKGKPTGGWARIMALIDSKLCTRLDIYGFSAGGGKYFDQRATVKEAHVVRIEHFSSRMLMATGMKGNVCVYGD